MTVPTVARHLGRWTVTLTMIAAILGCAAWLLPSTFGYSRYVITSGSMTGTYNQGSVVFEKKVPVADLKVGDVITYMPPAGSGVDHLVTHRIYRIEEAQGGGTLFTTKGDHNNGADPWHFQLSSQQQTVVQFGVPHVGWVFIALANKTTRMLAIGLPAALIALNALAQLISTLRRRDVVPSDNAPSRWDSPSIAEQVLEVV